MLLKLYFWDPGIFRLVHDDALSRLLNVVIHAEVGCAPVDQHTVVARHRGKLVVRLTEKKTSLIIMLNRIFSNYFAVDFFGFVNVG